MVVTFTNSLGAIAGRSDVTHAEREHAKDEHAATRADLARLAKERATLQFTPTDASAVQAAKLAVEAAEEVRRAECDKRGPQCRLRETAEQTKRDALAVVITDKAKTERAGALDKDMDTIRSKLAQIQPVQNPNPLGTALELILGGRAIVLTAWQHAIVAAVFELVIVGAMVSFEALGHTPAPVPVEPARAGRVVPKKPLPPASVAEFLADVLDADPDGEVDVHALYDAFEAWCKTHGRGLLSGRVFLEHLRNIRDKVGLDMESRGETVYCLGVRLAT